MTPNLGAILLLYLDRQAVQTREPIICGVVATVLANALNVTLGNLHPLAGERLLGFHTLRSCHMVSRVNGRYIVHIPGAERTYPAPVPHYLFSIKDRHLHYDVQVEQDRPEEQDDIEEVPEHDDEVEQEEEGPEQEEQPCYTTYHDISEL
jgi:hypothetical protein